MKLSILLGVLILLSGCVAIGPSYDVRLSGSVVNATGGESVAGSRVWVHGLTTGFTANTRTSSVGLFSLAVPPDRFEIKLSKEGYSTSHVYNVEATKNVHVPIIQRELFNPRWSTRPPAIELFGVSDGGSFLGPIHFEVDTEADNDIQFIYVALGKTPGSSFITAPRQSYSQTPRTGNQSIDPADYGVRGPTTFEVVVYDLNGNRSHLIRHINILPEAGLVQPPQSLNAIAVTLGKQIEFFGTGPGPETGPTAALNDTNLYVELTWLPSPNADLSGYRIYRSLNGVTFTLLGSVNAEQLGYKDHGAGLTVGQPIQYYVTAFRDGDESVPSQLVQTTPLAAFSVRLELPADDVWGVSREPLFRWRPSRAVGAHQIYGVMLWDTVLGEDSFWITPDPPNFLVDEASYRWNQDGQMTDTPWEVLQSQRIYEWQIAYAAAVDDLEAPTAVSIAVNRFDLEHPNIPISPIGIGATDNFSFTTGN